MNETHETEHFESVTNYWKYQIKIVADFDEVKKFHIELYFDGKLVEEKDCTDYESVGSCLDDVITNIYYYDIEHM